MKIRRNPTVTAEGIRLNTGQSYSSDISQLFRFNVDDRCSKVMSQRRLESDPASCVRVRVTGRVSHGALEGNYKGMG